METALLALAEIEREREHSTSCWPSASAPNNTFQYNLLCPWGYQLIFGPEINPLRLLPDFHFPHCACLSLFVSPSHQYNTNLWQCELVGRVNFQTNAFSRYTALCIVCIFRCSCILKSAQGRTKERGASVVFTARCGSIAVATELYLLSGSQENFCRNFLINFSLSSSTPRELLEQKQLLSVAEQSPFKFEAT